MKGFDSDIDTALSDGLFGGSGFLWLLPKNG